MSKPRDHVPPRASLRVLLVDDEPSILRMFRTALENYGYETDGAHNIEDACARLDSNRFDVVVSDVNTPGGNGFDLLSAVHRLRIDVPIIVMTGKPSADFAIKALGAGASRAVVKPIMPPALRDLIESVVAERRARVGAGQEMLLPHRHPTDGAP